MHPRVSIFVARAPYSLILEERMLLLVSIWLMFQGLEGNLIKAIGPMLFNTVAQRRVYGSIDLVDVE